MERDAGAYERIYNGDIENGAILLGQSIGIIKSVDDVNDIMERIMKEAKTAIQKNAAMLK
jgi:NAD(P)H-dependent flavin oxidoreductase YrpB (nitropropane dioxygenase family)